MFLYFRTVFPGDTFNFCSFLAVFVAAELSADPWGAAFAVPLPPADAPADAEGVLVFAALLGDAEGVPAAAAPVPEEAAKEAAGFAALPADAEGVAAEEFPLPAYELPVTP